MRTRGSPNPQGATNESIGTFCGRHVKTPRCFRNRFEPCKQRHQAFHPSELDADALLYTANMRQWRAAVIIRAVTATVATEASISYQISRENPSGPEE